ncbi:hypothetical protein [Absidia glauca]|uniref:Yeast cell wall synthesis Kre9/Knh1-like N-terminal domain-containing protein n=1 Tax=Absidia glauca TaxID=4829 RepID=A0A168NBS4_ABSGL|nr:hypothetical protein [Absidia glauca]
MIFASWSVLFISLVGAQQIPLVSITAPVQNAAYSAGQRLVISWLNPQVDVIPQIQICRGAPNALQPIAVIALNVDAKANGSYAYEIPSDYQYGNDYAFILGLPPNVVITSPFTINAKTRT